MHAVILSAALLVAAAQAYQPWEWVHNTKARQEQAIATRLLRRYDDTVRPGKSFINDTGAPVVVNVSVEILSLSSFNDVTMEFTGQIRFQQEWYDSRLKFRDPSFRSHEFISLADDQNLWHPDTFFQNEQKGHAHLIDKPNNFIQFRGDGLVQYNKRLTMSFSCPMNLMLFPHGVPLPHDNQTCSIEFGSYAYTTGDIIYAWSPSNVKVADNVSESLPKFSISNFSNMSCDSVTSTGTYGCLKIQLILQREFSYFLLQLYIPSCMLVFVSCLSFWIDWRSAPSRVPLTIVTLLTITTQAHGINANLPPVSYTKAIDIWIGACVVFIFGSLIEYAIVNYIGSNEEKRNAKMRKEGERGNGFNAILQRFGIHQPSDEESGGRYIRCYAQNDYVAFRGGPGEEDAHPSSLRQRLIHKFTTAFPPSPRQLETLRFRRNRDYNKELEQEWEEGDCFEASEYVEYRRTQYLLLEQKHRKKRGLWEMMKGTMEEASRAERIDILSRGLFPLGFIGFNLTYWTLYLPRN